VHRPWEARETSARSKRVLERTQRLLRLLDVEEVLEDLGLEVVDRKGADVYCACPDPNHVDANPSFHVCVEDVEDREGRCRLGWFNCWSHPGGLRGLNFLDLVAKVRDGVWENEDGDQQWPTDDQRAAAAAWLRAEYLGRGTKDDENLRVDALRKRARATPVAWRDLLWPPSAPIERARDPFVEYLARRHVPLGRAVDLGVRAVSVPGDALRGAVGRTCPGVLFPIVWEGRQVNWFLRSIVKVAPRDKGRYCPGTPLGKAGVLWAPDGLRFDRPVVICEGIFSAERARTVALCHGVPATVVATLGGRLLPEQAKHLRAAPLVIHLGDGDAGGDTLLETVEEQLGRFTRVVSRRMPDGKDSNDAEEVDVLNALRASDERATRGVRVCFRASVRRLP
jgi:hypothetical protein